MYYQTEALEQAENTHPNDWDSIQTLIDMSGDVREKVELERIMIKKFHEYEAINGDL